MKQIPDSHRKTKKKNIVDDSEQNIYAFEQLTKERKPKEVQFETLHKRCTFYLTKDQMNDLDRVIDAKSKREQRKKGIKTDLMNLVIEKMIQESPALDEIDPMFFYVNENTHIRNTFFIKKEYLKQIDDLVEKRGKERENKRGVKTALFTHSFLKTLLEEEMKLAKS